MTAHKDYFSVNAHLSLVEVLLRLISSILNKPHVCIFHYFLYPPTGYVDHALLSALAQYALMEDMAQIVSFSLNFESCAKFCNTIIAVITDFWKEIYINSLTGFKV